MDFEKKDLNKLALAFYAINVKYRSSSDPALVNLRTHIVQYYQAEGVAGVTKIDGEKHRGTLNPEDYFVDAQPKQAKKPSKYAAFNHPSTGLGKPNSQRPTGSRRMLQQKPSLQISQEEESTEEVSTQTENVKAAVAEVENQATEIVNDLNESQEKKDFPDPVVVGAPDLLPEDLLRIKTMSAKEVIAEFGRPMLVKWLESDGATSVAEKSSDRQVANAVIQRLNSNG